jgi:paraquat-inducible protein B
MSQKANPTLIGLFVLGAITLITIGVLIFGSGKFFRETETYVLFFHGDVANLKPGAPVTFRGVKIGSVTSVVLNFDARDMAVRIPVFIEIDNRQIRMVNGEISDEQRENIIIELVNRGLRAQLKMQSLLTGQLSVELDFHPETQPRLLGEKASLNGEEYIELPTIPSDIERLQKTLKQLPFETMVAKAIGSLEAMEEILKSEELKEALGSFTKTMKNVEDLAAVLKQQVPEIAASAGETITEIRGMVESTDQKIATVSTKLETALDDARLMVNSTNKLVGTVNGEVRPLAKNIQQTLASARTTLKRMDDTLSAFKGIATKDAAMGYKLYSTLDELSDAARSIRIFAEYLERHPEALIRGKGGTQLP